MFIFHHVCCFFGEELKNMKTIHIHWNHLTYIFTSTKILGTVQCRCACSNRGASSIVRLGHFLDCWVGWPRKLFQSSNPRHKDGAAKKTVNSCRIVGYKGKPCFFLIWKSEQGGVCACVCVLFKENWTNHQPAKKKGQNQSRCWIICICLGKSDFKMLAKSSEGQVDQPSTSDPWICCRW